MNDLLLSNDDLDAYRSVSKQVKNPGARSVEKPGRHRQRNFLAEAAGGVVFGSTSGKTWTMAEISRVAWR